MHNKAMDQVSLQRVKDLITQNENIAIAVGKNPSLDEMAAALSLYLSLSSVNKKVTVATPEDPLVEISSLVGIDKVGKSIGGEEGDLVVSFPYKEGEIDKVSYTLDQGFLNIVVKAGSNGLSFSENEVKYKRGGAAPSLLFIVGTPRISDLGNLYDVEKLKDVTVVNIDNKSDNQGFGDLVLVNPRLSSVSESMAELLFTLGLPIDLDTAQNLLSGITFATSNFQKPNTSTLAFEMASIMMKKGALRGIGTMTNVSRSFPQDPSDFMMPDTSFEEPASAKQSPAEEKTPKTGKNPPNDWLTPKVYRGSTNLS